MQKNTHAWLLSALAFLSAGCQKEEALATCLGSCTTITGRLVTGQPQVGIDGAAVTVKWVTVNGAWVKAKPKARTTTDANGRYTATFFIENEELRDGYFSVFYAVDKNNYYTIGEDQFAFNKLARDTSVVVPTYVIPRKAYVRLVITNQPQLLADKGQFISDFNTCYGLNNVFSKNIQGGGAVVFWDGLPSENPLPIAGDQSMLIRSSKTKNGVRTVRTDSVFIAAGTTQTYSVTY